MRSTETRLALSPAERASKALLRLCWFALIPALAAVFCLRFLLPSPFSENAGEAGRALGRAAADSPLVVGAALLLLFAALLGYWRFRLPGGRYLSSLPNALVSQLPVSRIGEVEAAYETWVKLQGFPARGQTPVGRARRFAGWWLLPIAVAAVAGLFVRERVLGSYRVLSTSMLPTLEPGQTLAADKLAYRRVLSSKTVARPRRGDIIVFRRRQGEGSDELVKRVLGLPGDQLSFRHGFPVINGWQVPHCDAGRYAQIGAGSEFDGRLLVEFLEGHAYLTVYSPIARAAEDYQVKSNEVFVLGDNRNGSLDSRFWNDGKPSGLPLTEIDARVTRVLTRAHRDGTPGFESFLQPVDRELVLEGLDQQTLKAGVEQCLRQMPKQTQPPGPNSAS